MRIKRMLIWIYLVGGIVMGLGAVDFILHNSESAVDYCRGAPHSHPFTN